MKTRGDHRFRYKKARAAWPEVAMLLASIAAIAVIGPLRGVLSFSPVLLFFATMTLLAVPGAVLARLFSLALRSATAVPVAFALSVGLFALVGIPALVMHLTLGFYLRVCGGVLAVALAVLAVSALLNRGKRGSGENGEEPAHQTKRRTDRFGALLWIPFSLAGVALAFAAWSVEHPPGADIWLYLAYVRDYLERSPLGLYLPYSASEATGFSRLAVNGWLLEQAAIARVSGIDPVALVLDYLAPALVALSLLAFCGLALVLTGSRTAALLSGCLYALFLLTNMDSSLVSPGSEFVGRITEDKFVTRFLFLPVTLGAAVLFLRERRLRYLAAFFSLCLSAAAVHPLGPVFVGISVVGLCLLHVALRPRDGGSWAGSGGIVAALVALAAPPAALLVASTGRLIPEGVTDSERSALQLQGAELNEHLLMLGDGSYIMHPSLVTDPFVLAGCLVGVPFLIRRIREPAAQLLLGILVIVPVLVYLPPVAVLLGDLVGPWNLWRLAWPLPLAALLSLGWATWTILEVVGRWVIGWGFPAALPRLAPLVLVAALAGGVLPVILEGMRSADASEEVTQVNCREPFFEKLRGLREPGVILAPNRENTCIPAYLAEASVVSYRSTGLLNGAEAAPQESSETAGDATPPKGAADAQTFFGAETFDAETFQILWRYGVEHAAVPADSPLNLWLERLPGFEETEISDGNYRVYRVNREGLRESTLVQANGALNAGDPETAASLYESVLSTSVNEEEWFLAYVGLGMAYEEIPGLRAEATASFEQALALDPESAVVYRLLASAYERQGDEEGTVAALERAVALEPGDTDLRLRLANALMEAQREEDAVEQYRAVVEAHPEVPEYRIKLGEALGVTDDVEAARREIERAVAANPLSPRIQTVAGEAFRRMERPEEALEYHERATELAPEDPARALGLGRTYADLASKGNVGKDYFAAAEDKLRGVAGSDAAKDAQRVQALVSLAELYETRGMDEEARAAYEQAIELAPGSRKVKKGLEGLDQS